jgi:hypothetical protein
LLSISFAENVIYDYAGCGTVHLGSYGSATQEIPPLVSNAVVHHIPTLRQTNLIHILPYFLCKYSFNSVLPSTTEVFKVGCFRFSVAQLSWALRYTPESRG